MAKTKDNARRYVMTRTERVANWRVRMKEKGFRPITVWIPNTKAAAAKIRTLAKALLEAGE